MIWTKKRWIFLALLLLPTLSLAAPEPPETAENGFLPADSAPYVYHSRDEGRWMYLDDELFVDIYRYYDTGLELEWFETFVTCQGATRMASLLSQQEGRSPGKSFQTPLQIAETHQPVLAINDDFFGSRWYNDKKTGVILRDGEILFEETFKTGANEFPPLEVLAVFADGSLRTFDSQEYTGQEYLDMGVVDTYAFGPILLRDGELGPRVLDENYSPYREPRTALGMIEPNAYVILTVSGRTEQSHGVHLLWLAERMRALGASEALNLDGGRTTYLWFMGDLINYSAELKGTSLRTITSMIGFGYAPQVWTQDSAK